jgi:iron complex transport system substrate-binding protein
MNRRLAALFSFFAVMAAGALAGGGESAAPPRIISLYAAHTEVLLRLGARDNIIGVSKQETYDGPETEGWRPDVYSFQDDVEKFLAAKPDIVLIRPQHAAAGGGRMKDTLERAGIRVLPMQVIRASALYPYWRELAALVGREDEAERMIADFEREIGRARDAAANRRDKPGVFIEATHREVKTFTPDSLPMWLVELAGGRNIAADAEPASPGVIIADYGPERLLAKASEAAVFISQSGAMNRTSLDAIRERDIYQPLSAFREGRVYMIPEAVLARPTPSLLRGLRLLSDAINAFPGGAPK